MQVQPPNWHSGLSGIFSTPRISQGIFSGIGCVGLRILDFAIFRFIGCGGGGVFSICTPLPRGGGSAAVAPLIPAPIAPEISINSQRSYRSPGLLFVAADLPTAPENEDDGARQSDRRVDHRSDSKGMCFGSLIPRAA
jgi:hypothetical protein